MPKHILIAEDDRLILLTLSEGLSSAGYRVTAAPNGEIAWQSVQNEMPDLILLDISMPIMNGLTLARKVREISDVPILFLTAYPDEEQVESAVSMGSYGYLVKPLEVHQIIPSVELALAKCNEIRMLRTTESQLQTAMQSFRDISVAIGILKERHGMTEDEAFDAMRRYARSQRRKMYSIASEIVGGSLSLHQFHHK